MKGVQCYELFEGIALKNHAFSFSFHSVYNSYTMIFFIYVFIFLLKVILVDLFVNDFTCNVISSFLYIT